MFFEASSATWRYQGAYRCNDWRLRSSRNRNNRSRNGRGFGLSFGFSLGGSGRYRRRFRTLTRWSWWLPFRWWMYQIREELSQIRSIIAKPPIHLQSSYVQISNLWKQECGCVDIKRITTNTAILDSCLDSFAIDANVSTTYPSLWFVKECIALQFKFQWWVHWLNRVRLG